MKTVIEMALEAGFLSSDESCGIYAQSDFDGLICIEEYAVGEKVKRFAALVRADEREACAKVCESTAWTSSIEEWRDMTKKDVSSKSMLACATTIRARSNT